MIEKVVIKEEIISDVQSFKSKVENSQIVAFAEGEAQNYKGLENEIRKTNRKYILNGIIKRNVVSITILL